MTNLLPGECQLVHQADGEGAATKVHQHQQRAQVITRKRHVPISEGNEDGPGEAVTAVRPATGLMSDPRMMGSVRG